MLVNVGKERCDKQETASGEGRWGCKVTVSSGCCNVDSNGEKGTCVRMSRQVHVGVNRGADDEGGWRLETGGSVLHGGQHSR